MSAIVMMGFEFNRIMKTLKPFTDPHETRKALRYIKLEHEAGSNIVTAVALDGFTLGKITAAAEGEEAFEAIVPPMPQTKASLVTITAGDGKITFDHEDLYAITYKAFDKPYINWRQIMPTGNDNAEYKIGVNPKYLAKVLNALPKGTGNVVLKFGTPVQPILIEPMWSSGDQYLVLPTRLS